MAKSFSNPVAQQVVPFNYETHEVKTLLINDAPYFVAKDVCNILGLDNIAMALSKLDDDEKLTSKLLMSGQNREVWLINESGLYTLILRSNKPEAKRFRKWVTSEVLPSIRQTGQYATPSVQKPISLPLMAYDLHKHLDLRMNYYDFLVRVLTTGSHGIDYTIVETEGNGLITDLKLTLEFAEFLSIIGFPTKQLIKELRAKSKKALKKTISITLQINQ